MVYSQFDNYTSV